MKDVGKVIGGGTPSTHNAQYWSDSKIPWITPADLGKNKSLEIQKGTRFLSEEGLKHSAAQLLPKGSIIYSSRAPIGHVAIAANSLCTNQGCKSLAPNQELVDSRWVYYVLIALTPEIISRASGTTFKEISGKQFGNTFFPLPPLPEQHRIVRKIEKLIPLIEIYGKSFDQWKNINESLWIQLRSSLLQEAIQGKLVPQLDNELPILEGSDYPESGFFSLPHNWKWQELKSSVLILNGDRSSYYPAKYSLTNDNTGNPFVSALNLSNGEISQNQLKFLSIAQMEALRAGKIHQNDILLCIRGSLGKFGVARKTGGAIASSLVILRIKDLKKLSLDYLLLLIQSKIFQIQIKNKKNGTAQPNLSAKDLSHFVIPIPPFEEQNRIVQKVKSIFNQLENMSPVSDQYLIDD
jgi:type I restriction enzyme S subunit